MSALTWGGMFAGYGGLEMGAQSILGGESRWFAEFEAAPSRVLAHHWPDVPNLGDVTKVDWTKVEPVDVITGGSPCQDLSHAGKRKGMTTGTRSNLWVEMREAIAVIRPQLVIWENVRGAYSACADSEMGSCPRCVGDDPTGEHAPFLRALGRVLGDLSDLRYDARWYGLRASDVGACHGRFRVFVFAMPSDADHSGLQGLADQAGAAQARRHGHPLAGAGRPDLTLLPTPAVNDMGKAYTPEEWDAWTAKMQASHGNGNGHGKSLEIEAQRISLLPTPRVGGRGANEAELARNSPNLETTVSVLLPTPRSTRGGSATETAALLPTPRATDGTKGGPNQRGSSGDLMLPSAAALLPTPRAIDATGVRTSQRAKDLYSSKDSMGDVVAKQDWAQYEVAIRRHEAVMGRPAPLPTEPGPKGGARLSPKFVEWMMWLPESHVTDPAIWEGLTDKKGRPLKGDRLLSAARNAQLKMLGNGVVTAQVAAAARRFVADVASERAA